MPPNECKTQRKDFECHYADREIIPKIAQLQYQQNGFKETLKEIRDIIKEETKKCYDASVGLHKRFDEFSLRTHHQPQESGIPWKIILAIFVAISGTEGGKAILLRLLQP